MQPSGNGQRACEFKGSSMPLLFSNSFLVRSKMPNSNAKKRKGLRREAGGEPAWTPSGVKPSRKWRKDSQPEGRGYSVNMS